MRQVKLDYILIPSDITPMRLDGLLIKTRNMLCLKKSRSREKYIILIIILQEKLIYSDYRKGNKAKDFVETVYGRIGHSGFECYDKIKNSPVYVDGVLMNPWGQ